MERAVLLRDLREHGRLPPAFEAAQPPVVRLIRWLLQPNPAERPTAVEVLRSELLPPQVLDEQLTDLLRCLPDNPAMHEKVGRGGVAGRRTRLMCRRWTGGCAMLLPLL